MAARVGTAERAPMARGEARASWPAVRDGFAVLSIALALFFGIVVAGALIAYLLRSIVQKVGLGWFDRFLGGLFGLVRGFVICSVLLLAMVAFSIKIAVVQDSTFAPYVLLGARVVAAGLPRDLSSQFQTGLERFRKALIERDKKASGK